MAVTAALFFSFPVKLFASFNNAFPDSGLPNEKSIQLPLMSLSEHVVQDYAATSLSLKAHPVSFVRDQLNQLGIVATEKLPELVDGMPVKVAGLVLVRQRPGTASGI